MSAVTEVGGTPVPDGLPDVFGEFCAAGLWPGLGRKMAGQLAAAGITGPALVTAERLERIDGVSGDRAAWLAAAFHDARPCYETAQLLAACRVPARFAGPAVAMLGRTAQDQLREDPWRLLALPQIRPDQADWFARKLLGGQASPQDQRRGRALVSYLLTRAARDGHTAVPAGVIAGALARFRIEDPAAAIAAAVDEGGVLPFEADPGEGLTGDELAGDDGADEDRRRGGGLGRHPAGPGPLRHGRGDGRGRAAAAGRPGRAARSRPGSRPRPGRGPGPGSRPGTPLRVPPRPRTWTPLSRRPSGRLPSTAFPCSPAARAPGRAVRSRRWWRWPPSVACGVALAAPTGRAAKRLEELTGAPATTVHRLLGAQGGGAGAADPGSRRSAARPPRGRRSGGRRPGARAGGPPAVAGRPSGAGERAWVFSRNEEWPLDADLVVVDEASMLDAELAAALVEACPDGARLLLVGDPAQLPSIGPGRVLGDIIDSGAVPVTELTRLYRQRDGGVIARLATEVRGGTLPPVDSPDREVVVLAARSSGEAAHRVMQLVTDSIPRALGIPAADIQVITPVHKGPAGTIALNRALKERLNPGPGAHGGFDPGDRVVSVANHADAGFANGEVGTVVGRGDGGLQVAFPAAPVCVPGKFLSDLRHGWALTVHRAQGSEWPAVVAVFPAEAAAMLSRPLVYTALTRAQRHLSVVHGAGPALSRAVSTVGEPPRVTRLGGLLTGM